MKTERNKELECPYDSSVDCYILEKCDVSCRFKE